MNKWSQKLITGILLFLAAVATPVWAVNFGVFGDISYTDSNVSGATNAFALGGLDLYAQESIDENTRAFVELVIENNGSEFVIDLERLWISRSVSDSMNISAGRFHTPLGYWNRSYHHGALLFDTITRPAFLEYEDAGTAILPLHIVGLMFDGDMTMGDGNLAYEFGIGNGPSYDTSGGYGSSEININNTSDPNRAKSPVLRVTYALDAIPLQFGVFGMSNNVAESGTGGASGVAAGETLVQQTIAGVDLNYSGERFDAIAEYFQLKNDDKYGSTGSHTGTAYYLQFGYQITERFKPVYRYESLEFNDNDAYFTLLGSRQEKRHVAALRYDLDDSNALKLQVTNVRPKSGESSREYAIQWAFLIP